MAKINIYKDFLDKKILHIKELPKLGETPYVLKMNNIISHPELFDNITLLTENIIKTKDIKFNKICASGIESLPYAINVATSFEKGVFFINSKDHDCEDYNNIKNIKIEGNMEIDDKVLIIQTVVDNDFLLGNILKKLRKYGAEIAGIIIILDMCQGEFINLVDQNENIHKVLNVFDICNYYETNNLVDAFCTEKIKFYCEKTTKMNIKKLINDKNEKIIAEEQQKEQMKALNMALEQSPETNIDIQPTKEIFVGQ